MFPIIRPRRIRQNEVFRKMTRENEIKLDDLIYPLFVAAGKNIKNPVSSMPGVYQLCIDNLLREIEGAVGEGIPAIILFGLPEKKDEVATGAYAEKGIVQEAVRAVKKHFPQLAVITDVCLCEYTSHGHCGIIGENGEILNDPTLKLLAKTAVSHAQAGADMIAPSDMMDGRIGEIRETLDAHGFNSIPIMAYSAKYASAFYGPFREAAQSTPQFGDRRSYQMDSANTDEAIRETLLDIQEGADIVMVKPALSYLDIIYRIKEEFGYPVAAYNVSGEYAMIKAAGKAGWIDEEKLVSEILLSMKRAGADLILTYFARDEAKKIKRNLHQ